MIALSRRAFLSVPVAAAVASACQRQAPQYRVEDFRLPDRSAVGLFAASYGVDLADVIGRGLKELAIDVRGKRVLLKPNMVEYEAGEAINTHPLVVAGAAVALRRAGAAEVVVAEGPGHRRDIEYLLTATGLFDHLRELDVRFVDLNHDDVRETPLRSWFTGLATLALPVSILAADLVVTMPKLKTHHWAGMTCSMKNLFGTVPGAVYGWPKNILHFRGIPASILDLVSTVRPGLSIVDGIVGMEGDGPIMGRPKPVGMIAMGTDLPAVDATCARVMGLEPARIPYLETAGDFLGNIDAARIDQRGEPIARFRTNFDLIESMRSIRATT
ncbi:MAG TPA: DUF362 domain-containing protein [Vicinamibacterales bacterium]|nr:DUF362 domain-containing protein [Vicinamibacterales bacterium]